MYKKGNTMKQKATKTDNIFISGCCELNSVPEKTYVEILTSIQLVNITLFVNKVFAEVTK